MLKNIVALSISAFVICTIANAEEPGPSAARIQARIETNDVTISVLQKHQAKIEKDRVAMKNCQNADNVDLCQKFIASCIQESLSIDQKIGQLKAQNEVLKGWQLSEDQKTFKSLAERLSKLNGFLKDFDKKQLSPEQETNKMAINSEIGLIEDLLGEKAPDVKISPKRRIENQWDKRSATRQKKVLHSEETVSTSKQEKSTVSDPR
jgi:hypothetical protein